jgi:hypothetical protein
MPRASDMGGAGFEPAKAVPPDLQSGPFGRLGIHPGSVSGVSTGPIALRVSGTPAEIEVPPMQPSRAGGESRTHNRRFTKPVLCRLSYASDRAHRAVKLPTIPSRSGHARAISHPGHETVAGGVLTRAFDTSSRSPVHGRRISPANATAFGHRRDPGAAGATRSGRDEASGAEYR